MYKTLRGLGKFIEGIGWVIVVGSSIFLFMTVIPLLVGGRDSFGGVLALASFLPIGGAAVFGILIVSYGQQIQCFVDIEENTRETNRLLQASPRSGPSSPRDAITAKPSVPGSVLGLTWAEREKEEAVRRIMTERQAQTTTCSNCHKTFPGDLKGQFCEECGARL